MAQKKLGKGLSALLSEDYSDHTIESTNAVKEGGITNISLDSIRSGQFQPRIHFDERYLQELADSIAKSGIMQPIVVRPIAENPDGSRYEIIAGERRWRAARIAGEYTIPVIIRDISDQQALELALIENVQRQDLSPLEEARGYQRLMDEFSYTQEELSNTVGKSRPHIANLLRLLNLPQPVKELLERGDLSMGHARALMKADSPEIIAKEVIRRGLNVRQTENLARAGASKAVRKPRVSQNGSAKNSHSSREKSEDIIALENVLKDASGLQVTIEDEGEMGRVIFTYHNLQELDAVLRQFSESFA